MRLLYKYTNDCFIADITYLQVRRTRTKKMMLKKVANNLLLFTV